MDARNPVPPGVRFDLIALVALDRAVPGADGTGLGLQHRVLVHLCRTESRSVAELAADSDLPVGVVRVLLGDLLELGRVTASRPVLPARLPDQRILREAVEGLRALWRDGGTGPEADGTAPNRIGHVLGQRSDMRRSHRADSGRTSRRRDAVAMMLPS